MADFLDIDKAVLLNGLAKPSIGNCAFSKKNEQ